MDKYLLLRLALNVFELSACVAAFIYWKKIRHSYWKWFAVYLAVITCTELTAEYIGYGLGNKQLNADINFFFSIPLQFLFFFWLFHKWFEQLGTKKWPLAGAVVYLASLVAEYFYFSYTQLWFLSFSYTAGNLILLVLVLFFFFKFINSEKVLNYRSSIMFWVCLGLLIFYLGSLPFYGLWNTLAAGSPGVFNSYWVFQIVLNYIMYILFALSFIWGKVK